MTTDSNDSNDVLVTFRIPGRWESGAELAAQMPPGTHFDGDDVRLPDGTRLTIEPLEPDDQFVGIFAQSCRREPTEDEKVAVENYTVNVCVSGLGGSMPQALSLMKASRLFIDAGGAGVFIDNSGVAFGASTWGELVDAAIEGDIDAYSFGFVGIVRGKTTSTTIGMHVLGLPEIVMRTKDFGGDGHVIVEMLQYICETDRVVDEGHIIADLDGPRFRVERTECEMPEGNAMFNPNGALKLIAVREDPGLN